MDRLSGVVERQKWDPKSLVGSFFHGTSERGWQGCVVAEVAPQVYLLELFEWFGGGSNEQKLMPLSEMMDWHFYDDAAWMINSYEHGLADRWELERKERSK
jgi:hypothetical protein